MYVGEGEGGLKEDAQVSARASTPRWGRRPGPRHRWRRTMPREGRSSACILMASLPRRKRSSSQPLIKRVSEKDSDRLAWVTCSLLWPSRLDLSCKEGGKGSRKIKIIIATDSLDSKARVKVNSKYGL